MSFCGSVRDQCAFLRLLVFDLVRIGSLQVGRELSAAVGRLEAALRTAVAAAVSRLQALVSGAAPAAAAAAAAAASGTPFASSSAPSGGAAGLSGAAEADPVALRLVAGRGERLAKLMKLGSGLSDPRFMVLPGSVGALDSFSATVQVRVGMGPSGWESDAVMTGSQGLSAGGVG